MNQCLAYPEILQSLLWEPLPTGRLGLPRLPNARANYIDMP